MTNTKTARELLGPEFIITEEEKLEGYASLNYRVKSEGVNYVLKYYDDPGEKALIETENQLLEQLNKSQFSYKVPAAVGGLRFYEDDTFARLISFMDGTLLSQTDLTESLAEQFGQAVAELHLQLAGQRSTVIESRKIHWDLQHALLNEEKVSAIPHASDAKLVNYFFDQYRQFVLPIQHQLRHSIIHSDLNDDNVFVKDGKIEGFIDFGDMTYAPLIYDVAIVLTYIMLANESDSFRFALSFLQGYHKVHPLAQKEIALLYHLIPTRLCVSVCNSALAKQNKADSTYVLSSEQKSWRLLQRWIKINPKWCYDYFAEPLGFKVEEIDTASAIEMRASHIGSAVSLSYNQPIHMIGAAFQYMYAADGSTYLDAYNNIPHVGHCHPDISSVLSTQVRKLNTNTRYLYTELSTCAEQLCKTMPEQIQKVFFVNSGSAATDLAIRMARTHTSRSAIAVLEHGYHGNTITGIEVSSYKFDRKGGQGQSDDIIKLPLPKAYKGARDTAQAYVKDAIEKIDHAMDQGMKPAALIVEPVSGCGGQVPLMNGYLSQLHAYLKSHNILLIVDEVQTGFGRMGNTYWGFEGHNIEPDLVILGKPMGNGHPVAAVITTDALDASFTNGMEFFSSFAGNPVSCVVASEVMQIIERENLQQNAHEVGMVLKNGLIELQQKYDSIGDVRGYGLFLGLELIDQEGNPATKLAGEMKEYMKSHKILVGTDGPFDNVIKIKPPMCFHEQNAQELLTKVVDFLNLKHV